MLTLRRKIGQRIYVGKDIVVSVGKIGTSYVEITIDAPKEIKILRSELLGKVQTNGPASSSNDQ